MKPETKTFTAIATGLALSALAAAAPLEKANVSQDAKWLLHLDIEGLVQSQIGGLLVDFAKAEHQKSNQSALSIDFDAALDELKSITFYGAKFEDDPAMNSVAVIQTGSKAQSIVDAWAVQEELNSPPGKAQLELLEDAPYPTYLLSKEVYLSMPSPGLMVVSKSFDQIEAAMGVIEGKRGSLESGNSQMKIVDRNGFFLIASAEGLNAIKKMPAEARILQKANGGQIALGESDGQFLANIMLSARDEAVASQLYRIVQGMIALVSFAQIENQSLETITRSTQVSYGKDHVSIDLKYSAESLIELVKPLLQEFAEPRAERRSEPKVAPHEVEIDDPVGGQRLEVLNVDARSDDGNFPFNTIDGDLSTHWASSGRDQWIRYLLASPSLLREIQVSWALGATRQTNFTIEVSEDGKNWTKLLDRRSSGDTEEFESYNVPDTPTRWVRLVCNGNNRNPRNTMQEIRFLGEPNHVAQ